jgi:hypothetical protein
MDDIRVFCIGGTFELRQVSKVPLAVVNANHAPLV